MVNTEQTQSLAIVLNLMVKSKRNKLVSSVILSFALALFSASVLLYFLVSSLIIILIMLLVFFTSLGIQLNRKIYKNLNQQAIIEHINYKFPEFQESSQLILKQNHHSLLQEIQAKKIQRLFSEDIIKIRLERSIPGVVIRPSLWIIIVSVVLFLGHGYFSNIEFITSEDSPQTLEPQLPLKIEAPILLNSKISVTPPQYTGLPETSFSVMNLKVVEGSTIDWLVNFSNAKKNYFLVNNDGNKEQLSPTKEGSYSYTSQFSQTSLYRIIYTDRVSSKTIGDVYTIEVVKDQLPVIKIIEPKLSLIEIPKHSDASFELAVEAKDDYGITEAKIIASVASGSGEAVQFRDVEFSFDEVTKRGSRQYYQKHWALRDLNMEPGDEVYFKVLIKDNKQPVSQVSKSSSVIVRWLDEESVEIAAEGIRISFIAEYFRSQRQIIIESEQLISDKGDLSSELFDKKSTELGHSQSDLKIKYGQYLGDETGDGPGEQLELTQGSHAEDIETENHQQEEHNEARPEAGHLHEEMADKNDLGGGTELISRFTHNHGSTEIGPISKQDPKSWMKMAVKEMWQAELHLMLSEPEKALTFEYRAYDYLKLATEAERIYVKRLGFEPPPVNEDARLSGELKDIKNYSLYIEDLPLADSDEILFQQVFTILSENSERLLNTKQIGLLMQLKARLLILAQTRPALIKYAASIERILSENTTSIQGCKDCSYLLKQKLWQMMPQARSKPRQRQSLLKRDGDYQKKIILLKKQLLLNDTVKGAEID